MLSINLLNYKVYEICESNPIYPNKLKHIGNPPKKIYAVGNIQLLNMSSIAIVGSRNSSDYGESVTRKITKDLVKNNIVITSGMAMGIDSVAHKTCIENGGRTIAVLGCGFNYIYPKENTKLFFEILEHNGLIISEYPLDTQVQTRNFPKRNRIISGLSMGVLVVEAAYRSGTSITARLAKNQGKPVFCVPNSLGSKNSYGTISLIQKGGILVKNADDILKELGIEPVVNNGESQNMMKKNKQIVFLDPKSKKIVNCIKEQRNLDAERLSLKTGIDINLVNEILTMLEIEGVLIDSGKNGYEVMDAYYE